MFVAAKTPSAVTSMAPRPMGRTSRPSAAKALTENGKPEVLFIGAEYCPFCAAQRWAMVNASSRFGTFSGLTTTHSSSTDTDPNTPTLTFYGSTFTSKYIALTTVEIEHNYRHRELVEHQRRLRAPADPDGRGARRSQTPMTYRVYIPFIDFGNSTPQVGNLTPLTPTMLDGLTWQQVATDDEHPVAPGRPGHHRQRELRDRGDLLSHQQPARDRVHADHPEPRRHPRQVAPPAGRTAARPGDNGS